MRAHRSATPRRTVALGLATCGLALAVSMATAPAAAASEVTALILGTTSLPNPVDDPNYLAGAMNNYVGATAACASGPCAVTSVVTPQEFWPFTGPRDLKINESITQGTHVLNLVVRDALVSDPRPIVIFGDSQSSSMLTLEKRGLAGLSEAEKSRITLVLTANPNRPNGGLLQRLAPFSVPVLDLIATGPTPTDTGIRTFDIAFQYDGVADFPQYPLNLLADLNLLAGADIHHSYMTGRNGYTESELAQALNDPANRQTYGDTTYISIPAKQLPLLAPLRQFGRATGLTALTTPIADLIEPALRVLVELGYDRTSSYGQPAQFGLVPKIDPRRLVSDLAVAVKQGVNAALADLGGIRNQQEPSPPNRANDTRSLHRAAGEDRRAKPAAARTRTPADHHPGGSRRGSRAAH